MRSSAYTVSQIFPIVLLPDQFSAESPPQGPSEGSPRAAKYELIASALLSALVENKSV